MSHEPGCVCVCACEPVPGRYIVVCGSGCLTAMEMEGMNGEEGDDNLVDR